MFFLLLSTNYSYRRKKILFPCDLHVCVTTCQHARNDNLSLAEHIIHLSHYFPVISGVNCIVGGIFLHPSQFIFLVFVSVEFCVIQQLLLFKCSVITVTLGCLYTLCLPACLKLYFGYCSVESDLLNTVLPLL